MSEMPAMHGWHSSVRGRLAGTTALLLTGFGTVMLSLLYLGMRFVPSYQLTPTTGAGAPSLTPVPGVTKAPAFTAAGPLHIVISSAGGIVSTLLLIGATVLVVTVVVSAVVAWVLARRFLRPLDELARVSAAFGDSELGHRAPGTGRDDEFGMVTRAFNSMLDRAERAMTINQRFAANASHELTSPLATTKTLLDVACQDLAAVELGPLLSKLSAANDRSIATVEALLDLADVRRAAIDLHAVDMAAVVAAGVRELAAEAADQGVAFRSHLDPCEAAANLPLLRQAVGNLLANAIRHNAIGGTVDVETGTDRQGRWAWVGIRNTGPVVDPGVIRLLGEPFYRIRPRYRPVGQRDSHGLGLPIALAIAEALDGTLVLTANPEGGLTTELRIPAVGSTGGAALSAT